MKTLDWLENFYFKYFSSSTADTKDSWVRYVVFGVMLIPFVAGMWFTAVGFMNLAQFFGDILFVLVTIFAVPWVIVYYYHNYKLKKMQKKWK